MTRDKGFDFENVFEGKGCSKCHRSGFMGRIGLYEQVVVDDLLRDLISSNPSIMKLRAHAAKKGMTSLRKDGIEKVREGITTLGEVLRVSEETY